MRRAAIDAATHPAFERLVLVAIGANTACLALADYAAVAPGSGGALDASWRVSWRNAVVAEVDTWCSALFALECVLKLVAMGLGPEGHGSYDLSCSFFTACPV